MHIKYINQDAEDDDEEESEKDDAEKSAEQKSPNAMISIADEDFFFINLLLLFYEHICVHIQLFVFL